MAEKKSGKFFEKLSSPLVKTPNASFKGWISDGWGSGWEVWNRSRWRRCFIADLASVSSEINLVIAAVAAEGFSPDFRVIVGVLKVSDLEMSRVAMSMVRSIVLFLLYIGGCVFFG